MSRWMHRTCDTVLADRESELRKSNTRSTQLEEALDTALAQSHRRLDLLVQASKDLMNAHVNAHIEHEQLTAELEATTAREAALLKEIDTLQCRINDLEEENTSRKAVLEARRRRAAEKALGGAWDGPRNEKSSGQAQVAQTMLTLPLASYDVTVAYQRGGNGDWYWTVDGEPVDTNTGFVLTTEEEVLTGRYGFTDSELSQIRHAAEKAHRQLQTLTSEEF